jgi:hypothetical protein
MEPKLVSNVRGTQKNLFVNLIHLIGPNLESRLVLINDLITTLLLAKCSKAVQPALQLVLVVFGAMTSANGLLVILAIPPTANVRPDLIMASAREMPKKTMVTSQ